MPAPVTLIAQDGDTLDELAWRDASLGPSALVALCNANPRLSERVVLNAGDTVIVPTELYQQPAQSRTRSRTQLWD
jgi:phage tail protein X